ncbi:hypothetical protein KJ596_03425, partial [Patescibacteria group bacterium]|nr:hypothetical protein [Patescibacteria group bacterium]MBU1867937.1 hypothetical protein [Patescibacteria group bacterium]
FSLGGIIARYYLNQHGEEKVDDLVTIGSPHLGAELLNYQDWVEGFPVIGEYIRVIVNELLSEFVEIAGLNGLDLESPAAQQVRPSSGFLLGLNDDPYSDVNCSVIAGDIDFELKQKVFFWELSKKFSVGDVCMSTTSAHGLPCSESSEITFSDANSLTANVINGFIPNHGYAYTLDFFRPDDIRYYHSQLVRQAEVIDSIMYKLQNE